MPAGFPLNHFLAPKCCDSCALPPNWQFVRKLTTAVAHRNMYLKLKTETKVNLILSNI